MSKWNSQGPTETSTDSEHRRHIRVSSFHSELRKATDLFFYKLLDLVKHQNVLTAMASSQV